MGSPAIEPTCQTKGSLRLGDALDVLACRQMVGLITSGLRFSITSSTMLITAASELARNTVIHGGGGTFSWEVVEAGETYGVKLRLADSPAWREAPGE
jgi:serine/threonine-protein kinase RsbT